MGQTRYAQVARDLAEGIASGRFPVGSLLPTELELAEHYGASRNTVRAALRELQELGLVSRRKKAGTRVEAASASSGYRPSLASIEDLIQFGAAHVRVVRKIEAPFSGISPPPANDRSLDRVSSGTHRRYAATDRGSRGAPSGLQS